jgi:hypothetical protein
MVSSGLLRRVALVRTDVSEEPGASFIRVTKIPLVVFLRSVRRLLVAACVVPSSLIFVTLMKEAPSSSETSVLTRAKRRNNPEDTILQKDSVTNKTWIQDWFLYLFAWIKSHKQLQSFETVSSTTLIIYLYQHLQQLLLNNGTSLNPSGTNWTNCSSWSNQTAGLAGYAPELQLELPSLT